ncbi:MAG: DUF1877 family protein [Nostoc sp. ChiSLP02]|nr:DUF1877 family protein [Nostoc sp. DedSLP05]MDZ8102973.1 DUF1877 family protein [Nostoc sp. DedSLP01]MDZ8183470.1 DUF1877 family protein [Nostoc sp. ChiSLP02]
MGIAASYRRVTPRKFERLQNDVAYASIFFGDDLETDEEIYTYFEALRNSDRYLDLDKHWQSLHFLFTGDFPYDTDNKGDTLLHKLFMGGSATPWEATYGMVRYLTVSEVNEIAEALNHISQEEFKSRLDNLLVPHQSRIYMEPQFLELQVQLIKFFNIAAQKGDIVLLSFD